MNYRRLTVPSIGLLAVILLALSLGSVGEAAAPAPDLLLTPYAHLPFVAKPSICPPWSANEYASGTAYQYDSDDPVRRAFDHADKNIELRGYTVNTDPGLKRDLIDCGPDDPKQPPQLATLFDPPRVPALAGFYRVHHWDWATSPDPGTRLGPILSPPVTALGLQTTPGETLRVPVSGYDIGGGMEVLVLFADQDTIALRYTREDSSASPGYTVHIDNICTDPNLLALYSALDDPSGPRYQYPNASYDLPNLYAGQSLGVARGSEVVVAIADTGSFQDPRSLDEWWQIRPGYPRYPADVYYTSQWALEQVRAPQAWGHSTGADIVIAVIDTGVDLDHPDLMSKVLTDLDKDFVNDDLTAADDHGHGTHVAGIAAAATDNGLGIAGLGWDVRILPLKVLDDEGNGDGLGLAAAIRYAANHGADVINMSLGGDVPCGWPVDVAATYAYTRGVTLIAAAGNNLGNTEMFPASCEHVLGVAATDQADAVAYYSNYGSHVSIAAPGSGIYSTLNGGSYGYDSGTSMATPHVAGLAALLVARYPSYTPDLVASAILDTAQDLGAPGWDQYYGCGRIDASLALSIGAVDTEPICLQGASPWREASPTTLEDGSYVPGEIIIELRPGVRAPSISGLYAAAARYLPEPGVWRLSVPRGREGSILAELESDPDVVRAGLNYLVSAQ